MSIWKFALFAGTALSMSAPALAASPAADPADSSEADTNDIAPAEVADIIVTARRSSERLQDVPVAVSVLAPATLEARGTFNPVDIVQSAPGLNVTASVGDRANLTYTIRGQGFSFGTVFPAVISYFNEVAVANLTQGQFFDLQNVQVLRGPQGVNFGRVTNGGNVMLTVQAPKEDFGGYITGKAGDYGLRGVTGAINIPLIKDKVLLRIAGESVRRDGFTLNEANGQKLDNVAYESVRAGLTIRPVDGIESITTLQYQNTHDNGTSVVFDGFNPAAAGLLPTVGQFSFLFAGAYGIAPNGSVRAIQPGDTPLSAPAYLASLQSQLAAQNARGIRKVNLVDDYYNKRRNLYLVNSTTIDLSDKIQLKNVFGYIHEKIDQASNFAGTNGAAVLTCTSSCPGASSAVPFYNRQQLSEELRLSGKLMNDRLTFAIGGYLDEQKPAGLYENATVNVAMLNRVGVNYITTKSRAVYGNFEYALTDALKINGGLRYTHDTFFSQQNTYLSPLDGGQTALFNFLTGPFGGSLPAPVANFVVAATFAPIPHGKCELYGVGSVLAGPTGSPCLTAQGAFNATTWQAGASYKFGSGQLFYGKVSKGYRPGGVNGSAPAGADPRYRPETDLSVEIGLKSDFRFNGMFLRTNLTGYTDRYKGIQKNVVLPGPVPVSLTQNVNNARIKGVEGEITFIPVDAITLGGNFAYTSAKFDKQTPPTVGNPCDRTATTTVGFCSDNRFNSVPEFQYALNAAVRLPVPEKYGSVSIGATMFHQSSVALTDTSVLNPESIQAPRTTVDLNVDWKNVGGQPVDLGFFVTNLTDEVYRIGTNNLSQNSSIGTSASIYAAPRMFGFSLKYRFGADAQ